MNTKIYILYGSIFRVQKQEKLNHGINKQGSGYL